MTQTNAEQLRADYLARLDHAMRDLPHGVASEIRGGVAEELEGLDADATVARIEQLGDPTRIAAEAQREVPAGPPSVVAAQAAPRQGPRPPATGTRGFAITAALTLSFGGVVLPVLGWFVGVALVCASSLWKVWEKVVAIVVPFVFTAVSFLVASTFTGFSGSASSGTSATETPSVNNPLVPGLGEWHILILLGLLLIPASGLWLLWRLRGRAAR